MAVDADPSAGTTGFKDALVSALQPLARGLAPLRHYFHFSSLISRIILLNLLVLIAIIGSVYYYSKTEGWLIEARRESLTIQGKIIAAALVGHDSLNSRPPAFDRNFLEPETGQPLLNDFNEFGLSEFRIDPAAVGPRLKRLITPTGTRARIYDLNGQMILDSERSLTLLPIGNRAPNTPSTNVPPPITSLWSRLRAWFTRYDLPLYRELAADEIYPEVRLALNDTITVMLQVTDLGQLIVSVAVPIKPRSVVEGVLLLSNKAGELEKLVQDEWRSILKISIVALIAIVISSVYLAGTIAVPLHRLSDAADKVRTSLRRREEIPDLTQRSDEVGRLSGTLRDMTAALYRRVEASERFAADVVHELKNPLTSVRSAAEAMSIVKTDEHRQALADTIQSDVHRLTRLIDDIGNTSRMDAEMALAEAHPVDMQALLTTLVGMYQDADSFSGQKITLNIVPHPFGANALIVNGHDSRLGQVVNNLLSNARSFSPSDGQVTVTARRTINTIEIIIDDEGPGIPSDNLEKIFQRFYTYRPDPDHFGKNSGLGLSICREIIIVHKGRIWAENRISDVAVPGGTETDRDEDQILGARFVINLPALYTTSLKGVKKSARSR